MPDAAFSFAEPAWLWLLLLLPFIVWMRWRAPLAESVFKRVAGTCLRCASLALLVIALAGPLENVFSNRADIVFVLDVSRSVDQQTAGDAMAFINRAIAAKEPDTRVALVVFGADAAVERLLGDSADAFGSLSVEVSRGGTDIARAIDVAVGLFQSQGQRRLVLLSDGQENQGSARLAASVARSVGVSMDTVTLARPETGDEVLVSQLHAPSLVNRQEPFELRVSVYSQRQLRTHLVITRNGSPLEELMLDLEPGETSYTLIDQLDDSGLYEYEAIVNSDADQVRENNRFQAFVQVKGAPKILHAVGDPAAGRYVTDALRTQGLAVDEVAGTALPASMHELVEYDLVILNNVPALDMSMAKMQLIEDYVRDAGGGLLMLGGDKSYGAGGYLGTPIERSLPVTMDIQTEVEIPSLAVTIIIDKSGSMGANEKLAVAKDAAYAAVQVLKPVDTVGVLAFAGTPEWSVSPQEVGNRREIVERLRLVGSGGNTDLHAAVQEAHRVMLEQSARVKHLILLSDGLSDTTTEAYNLVAEFADDDITLSAVAFGADANQALMESLAARGGGRYYFTREAGNVPRIFTSETLIVARNLFVEKSLVPRLHYPGELLQGLDPQALPPLSGYQRIFAKPAAQVLLAASAEDPLLASWRYGLGRSVAFSSDLSGRWTREWISWNQFGRFIAQTARWTMRRQGLERVLPRFRRSGQHTELIVDVLDRDDRYINGIEFEASVLNPLRESSRLEIKQISPGQYRGEFEVPREGRYYISLSGKADNLAVAPETFGLAVPYSPEFLELGVNQPLLKAIATETGGRMLPMKNASIPVIMSGHAVAPDHRGRVWWPALLVALILLLVEITLRKLLLPDAWQRALHRIGQRVLRQSGRRPDDSGPSQPAYEELVADITRARQAHLDALQQHRRPDPDDPAARARLYIAGHVAGRGQQRS